MEIGDKIGVIAQRDQERKLALQKKKEIKENSGADNEKLTVFNETFQSKLDAIHETIEKSNTLDKALLPEHFNNISKEILLLQKYIANSNIFLRTYDIKIYQQYLQVVTEKARNLEDVLLPKKKFGFKNKPKPCKTISHNDAKDQVDFQRKTPDFAMDFCGFSGKTGEILSLDSKEILKKDVTLENLENCTVKLLGTPSTLHITNLTNCKIFTGPVSSSIFATNCSNSVLVIACQQLRLHTSKNVNIYLHVTSRAIMEDCTGIQIAPYNLHYDGIDSDFTVSGLDRNTNNWNAIDDFNWLNLEKQSPHWSLMKEEDRLSSWDI